MWQLILALLGIAAFIVWIGERHAGADWGSAYVNWLDGWTRLICRFWHGLKDTQLNLPDKGGAIVVANHVSGLDPFLLVSASRRPLRFLIAREEYERRGLRWLFDAAGCIPVDRAGKPEQALRQALRALEQGEVIALFPHGTIHLDTDPPRRIKGGVARLAAWSQAAVYPVRIDGVAAEGKIMLAPFKRSRVTLTLTPPIPVTETELVKALDDITLAIETPVAK